MTQNMQSGVYLLTNEEAFKQLYLKIHTLAKATFIADKHSCGIEVLQYRRKSIESKNQYIEIEALHTLCEDFGIRFIINDNINMAQKFNVGVHLGQSDGSVITAKQLNIPMVGRTCHQSVSLAMKAEQDGADYVAFGVYKASLTKPNAKIIQPTLFTQLNKVINIDVCVIGGVELTDLAQLKRLGVRYFAMINGLLATNSSQFSQNVEQLTNWCEQLDNFKS